MNKDEIVLTKLQKGVQMLVTDKFWGILINEEHNPEYQTRIITLIGCALGETLDSFSFPIHWERFLKRRDCPKYMKIIRGVNINAYYPKLSLPKEENYITIDNLGEENTRNETGGIEQ